MRKALESLPWVRKAEIDFDKKRAAVTVEKRRYEIDALVKALKDAGFGGKLVEAGDKKQDPETSAAPRVAFQVIGMKKTKSGAT